MTILTIVPFIILLLGIATLPLTFPHFWESNRNKGIVGIIISLPVIVWLLANEPASLGHTLYEYFSFICLLGSLFVVSGGISVTGDLKALPKTNVTFLAIGAILANLIGTTGASMLLIRPFLKTNSERKITKHLPIFFIFIVSNCGGLLTPLGDPPLFLGYLRGVPFFWTLRLWPMWLFVIGLLLTVFYIWDSMAYRKESVKSIKSDSSHIEPIRIRGLVNIIFLAGIVCSVFLGTPYRELVMCCAAAASIFATPKINRKLNNFSWHPIVEVAVLFAAIFITMVPALELLRTHGSEFGITKPWHFFWLTGLLSSFLDNAPTYLTFLSLAQGLGTGGEIVGVTANILMAISVGAVFMGANTYIGNGPNFMVKAIADHAGFKTPSFFGYMKYSLLILFPIYFLITFVFFR